MAEKVVNQDKLDIEKVETAVEKYGQEAVQETLRERGFIQDTEEPAPTTEPQTTEGVKGFEEEQVVIPGVNTQPLTEPTPTPEPTPEPKVEEKAPPTVPGAIPGVVPPLPEEPKVEEIKSEQETIAEQKNYTFTKDNQGKVVFDPQTSDELLSLYETFGTDINIDKSSKNFSTLKKINAHFSPYKNASEDVILQGLKTNDIGVSGPTWDMLVRLNGGQPTPAMLAAQEEYEGGIKLNNVQTTTSIISGQPTETQVSITGDTLADLDSAYIAKVNQLFGDITAEYNDFKQGNEELSELNNDLTTLSEEIDELNTEKRRILDNVKERHPNLPLSAQLAIADKELDAVDDELFVKQREYNSALSTYKFKSEEAQGEFEFNQNIISAKMDLLGQMYGIKRGDVIRQQDIERQDKILADQISRQDELYKRAIADGDIERAKELKYQEELLKLQQKYADDIKVVGNRAFIRDNEGNWKEVFAVEGADIPTSTPDFIASQEGFSSVAYQDPAGVWTIGYGTTSIDGVPVQEGDSITEEQARQLLQEDIDRHSNWKTGITVDLTPSQEAALSSFEYNLGPYIWSKGAANILDMINKGDLEGAANEMLKYNKARDPGSGRLTVLEGLANRRQREADLLTKGFQLPEGVQQPIVETINGAEVILGSIGVPVDFERTIKNQIPATLLNSEVELEAANEVIKNLYGAGISKEEAAELFQGYKVDNVEDLQFGSNLIQLSRSLETIPDGLLGRLSAMINTGNRTGALGYLEFLQEQQYRKLNPDSPIRNESKAKITKLNKIEDFIRDKGGFGTGPIEGLFQKVIKDFKMTDIATLQTMMEDLNAKERLKLFGTSQTGGEEGTFDPLALDITLRMETLFDRIEVMKENELIDLNTARGLTLPSLTEDQVLYDSDLLELYNNPIDYRPEGRTSPYTSFLKEHNITQTTTDTETSNYTKNYIQNNLNP